MCTKTKHTKIFEPLDLESNAHRADCVSPALELVSITATKFRETKETTHTHTQGRLGKSPALELVSITATKSRETKETTHTHTQGRL